MKRCAECGTVVAVSGTWVPDHRDPLGPAGTLCPGSSSLRGER